MEVKMQRRHNIEVRTAFNGLFKTVGIGGAERCFVEGFIF